MPTVRRTAPAKWIVAGAGAVALLLVIRIVLDRDGVPKNNANQGLAAQPVARNAEAASAPTWVIVTGYDSTPEDARNALRAAKAAGSGDARTFRSRSGYNTVILMSNQQAAEAALPAVRRKVRPDAYPKSLDSFCPAFKNQTTEEIECGN